MVYLRSITLLGWYKRKCENARIVLCVNSLNQAFKSYNDERLGIILVLAQMLRSKVFNEEGFNKALNCPDGASRIELLNYYEVLEKLRLRTFSQAKSNNEPLQRMGLGFPPPIIEHTENTCHAIQLWMATLGVGLVPRKSAEMHMVWTKASTLIPYTRQSIAKLRVLEKLFQKTVKNDAPLFEVDDLEWEHSCYFVPVRFTK